MNEETPIGMLTRTGGAAMLTTPTKRRLGQNPHPESEGRVIVIITITQLIGSLVPASANVAATFYQLVAPLLG